MAGLGGVGAIPQILEALLHKQVLVQLLHLRSDINYHVNETVCVPRPFLYLGNQRAIPTFATTALAARAVMSSESENSSSDSSSSVEESLGAQIVQKFEKSAFDKREFLPNGCIDTLITECTVIRELAFTQKMEDKSNIKLVSFILNEGTKIFAIMLVAGFKGKDLLRAITQFRKNKLGDKSLPIMEGAENKVPLFWHPPKGPWDLPSIRRFCNDQWAFLAPVFSKERLNLELYTHDILPFTYQDDDVKSGAFGEVHQVTVHPFHDQNSVLTVRFVYSFLVLAALRPLL